MCRRIIWEISILSTQFCYELKTALKGKVCFSKDKAAEWHLVSQKNTLNMPLYKRNSYLWVRPSFLTLLIKNKCCWASRGLSGKESICQCRRHGFSPWSRKTPYAATCAPKLLSLCFRAWEPQLLKPEHPRTHAPQEKPPQREALAPQLESSPRLPQREKAHTAAKSQHGQKLNKWVSKLGQLRTRAVSLAWGPACARHHHSYFYRCLFSPLNTGIFWWIN